MSALVKYGLQYLGAVNTSASTFVADTMTTVNVDISQADIYIPAGFLIGTQKVIRKLGSNEAVPVTIHFDGETLGANALSTFQLYGNGESVVIEKVSTTRWEICESKISVDKTFRNKIINGNLDFWQRGTSVAIATGSARYLADRFSIQMAGTSAATTYSRQAFTLGQTDVPNNPRYYLRSVCTNGGDTTNGLHVLKHWVEDVTLLAGKTVTLSFYAKASAVLNMSIEINQLFGTGGSPSSNVDTFIQKIALSTTWKKFVFTFTVPSITGKTIGTDGVNTSALGITIFMSAGSSLNTRSGTLGIQTGTFDFAQFQLEEGEFATTFEEKSIELELALCQRYYEKSYDIEVVPGTAATSIIPIFSILDSGATTRYFSIAGGSFKVSKRIVPIILAWSEDGTANSLSVYNSNTTKKTISLYTFASIYGITRFDAAAGTAFLPHVAHWTANAEF